MNDLVSNTLSAIKNGYLSYKTEVLLPYSKLILSICEVLKKEGYLSDFKEVPVENKTNYKKVLANLKYVEDAQIKGLSGSTKKKPSLTEVKRISKPGLRVYKGKSALPWVLNGLGIAIISTPKGVMTDRQARKEGLGGEVLAYVW